MNHPPLRRAMDVSLSGSAHVSAASFSALSRVSSTGDSSRRTSEGQGSFSSSGEPVTTFPKNRITLFVISGLVWIEFLQ